MQKKHKMTGCARLFIVLLIIAPLAYLGASYYNGQDGIQNIKNLFGIGENKSETGKDTYDNTSKDLQDDVADKHREIQQLKDANEQLKKEIETLKSELEKLKGQ